ncbi:DEAD/DEAH box helicase [bacterium]|nr:DEAD/DEAH box helicase [bacterium]
MNYEQFDEFSLSPRILRAVKEEGYTQPTPVQARAIPELLAGRDLLATAQTGTGKTAAFALPLLHLLAERPAPDNHSIRALILTPTRELALQIDGCLHAYGKYLKIGSAVILGGVAQGPQVRALQKRPEILVATPGRLLDLMSQGYVRLDKIEMLVLDEADRMLDMGFINDVRKILERVPAERQTMFFSATLSTEISRLASDMLRDPVTVAITPPASVSRKIDQHVFFVGQDNKRDLLTGIIKRKNIRRALVFTRTKHRADRVMKQLVQEGVAADAIHGDKSQNARQRALSAFSHGKIRVLVATDVVARGIDVEGISHVINFELPNEPESYVHRIGRTARAGADGIALSFCCADEVGMLRGIEKLTRCEMTAEEDHEFHCTATAALYRSPRALPVAIPRKSPRRGDRPFTTHNGRANRRPQR